MADNSNTFNQEFTGADGVEYIVKFPFAGEYRLAQIEYNKTYGEAIKSGAVLRVKIHEYMQEQKVWSEERANKIVKISNSLSENEKKLAKGGIKLSEAVKIAKQMKRDRAEFQILATERAISDSNTAEGQAENARFQRLLTACLVYKSNGTPVYNSVETLLNEADETKVKVTNQAFEILGKMLYKLDDSFEVKLPENVFLKNWKMVDDKGRLIDEKGRLVNEDGHLINEEGRLINENGEFVDIEGNLITEEGDLKFDTPPVFFDDDGNPLTPPQ